MIVIGDPATNAGVAPVDVTNGLAVQIIPALPAGTNAIGKLAANSGVDIGDVDITSIAAGDNNIGNVDIVTLPTQGYSASATFTPTAASHVAGDCNGAAAEFALIGPSAGRIMITSASLEIDGGTAEATAWRLALFNITPPSALADNAAFALASGDRASFLGFIELGTAVDEVDSQWIEVHGINKQVKLAGTGIFAYLINRTTLTPAAVAHIVTLHAVAV